MLKQKIVNVTALLVVIGVFGAGCWWVLTSLGVVAAIVVTVAIIHLAAVAVKGFDDLTRLPF